MNLIAATATTSGAPGCSETVPCEPGSARRARTLVAAALSTWGMADLADAGTLIVTELLSNAIDHTSSRTARVVVHRTGEDRVRIGVADTGRGIPDARRPPETAEEGRGLLLIQALSDHWGYDRTPAGKLVWAELRSVDRR